MPYKLCPACRQTSYSAAGSNIWLCPCCGRDISAADQIRDRRNIIGLDAFRNQKSEVRGQRLEHQRLEVRG